jgi:hypothetical protein
MITFIYSTCRKNPKFDWFIDCLYNQAVECNFFGIQIVLVDFQLQYDKTRIETYKKIVDKRFDFVHVEPKPSAFQGKYRFSSKDYFAPAIPRNTGVCYAKHKYLLFIDDLSVMAPNSLRKIIDYSEKNIVVAFAYTKCYNLNVNNGNIITFDPVKGFEDHRLSIDSSSDLTPIRGSQFYGYAACPIDVLLSINGYDEICNTIGQEDCNFGVRLEKTGKSIFFSKDVIFYESEEGAFNDNIFTRLNRDIPEDLYRNLMKQYGITQRWHEGPFTQISLMVDLLARDKTWTEGNNYNLKDLRIKIFKGGSFDIETDAKTVDGILSKEL